MTRLIALAALCGWLALLAAGCTIKPIDATTRGLMDSVFDRHDAYVADDETLDDTERAVYLGETAALRDLLEAVPE